MQTCSGRNKSSLGRRGSWAWWYLQRPEELLLQGWSLGSSCAAPNQGTTEPQEPQGDVASPAQCELFRDLAGPALTHQSVHQTLSAPMWELSSWETSPFDVPAELQQARAELRSSGFNYRDFTTAESLGGLIIFTVAPAESRICPSTSSSSRCLHHTRCWSQPSCSFSPPQQSLFFHARSKLKFVTLSPSLVCIYLPELLSGPSQINK